MAYVLLAREGYKYAKKKKLDKKAKKEIAKRVKKK